MSYPGTLVGYIHYTLSGHPVGFRDSQYDSDDYDNPATFFVQEKHCTPFLCGTLISKDKLRSNVVKDIRQAVYQIPIYVSAPQIGL